MQDLTSNEGPKSSFGMSPGLSDLHQTRFRSRRRTIAKRPSKRIDSTRQATLTQLATGTLQETLYSDEQDTSAQEDVEKETSPQQNHTVPRQRDDDTSTLTNGVAFPLGRKANCKTTSKDGEARDRKRRKNNVPRTQVVLAEDEVSDEEDPLVARNAQNRQLPSLLNAHQPHVFGVSSTVGSKAFVAGRPQLNTPQRRKLRTIRSSESPENSPLFLAKAEGAAQVGRKISQRSQNQSRPPLGRISPNVKREIPHPPDFKSAVSTSLTEAWVKLEPPSQLDQSQDLPLTNTSHYDDDDLNARPLCASSSQDNRNHIDSDIPWLIPSPLIGIAQDFIEGPHQTAEPALPKYESAETIADSQSEGEVELKRCGPPVKVPCQRGGSRPRHGHATSSDKTTQPPSSTPPPPPGATNSPSMTSSIVRPFSQATTVETTPKTQRVEALFDQQRSKASSGRPSLSDPVPIPSSPPSVRSPTPRVYRDVPGFGDVPVLTESQMLPDSIVHFQLPYSEVEPSQASDGQDCA